MKKTYKNPCIINTNLIDTQSVFPAMSPPTIPSLALVAVGRALTSATRALPAIKLKSL